MTTDEIALLLRFAESVLDDPRPSKAEVNRLAAYAIKAGKALEIFEGYTLNLAPAMPTPPDPVGGPAISSFPDAVVHVDKVVSAGGSEQLRAIILQAIIIHGGIGSRATGIFTSESFGAAVAQRYAVKARPVEWSAGVLAGVDWVVRMPGSQGYWKVQTG